MTSVPESCLVQWRFQGLSRGSCAAGTIVVGDRNNDGRDPATIAAPIVPISPILATDKEAPSPSALRLAAPAEPGLRVRVRDASLRPVIIVARDHTKHMSNALVDFSQTMASRNRRMRSQELHSKDETAI